MTIIDTLVTKYTMDASGYIRGADQVKAATLRAGDALGEVVGRLTGIGDSFDVLKATTQAWAAYGLALGALGVVAVKQAASFDALAKSLEAVEGNSKLAAIEMQRLRDIARAPGLGLEEAVRGYTGLRNAGVGPNFAEEIIRQFGNANARAGGGRDELTRVLLAVQQIAMKPFIQGEELLQLSEAGIPASQLIRDRFGTADTEELKRRGITSEMILAALVEELAKLQRVGDGPANAIENLQVGIQQILGGMGTGLLGTLAPMIAEFTGIIERANAGGVFQEIGESMGAIVAAISGAAGGKSMEDLFLDLAAAVITVNQIIARVIQGVANVAKQVGEKFGWLGSIARVLADFGTMGTSIVRDLSLGFKRPGVGMQNIVGLFNENRQALLTNQQLGRQRVEQGPPNRPDGGETSSQTVKPVGDLPKELDRILGNSYQQYLKQIAENTEPLRQIARTVLAGGEMGRIGLTPIEVRGAPVMRELASAIGRYVDHAIDTRMVARRRAGLGTA